MIRYQRFDTNSKQVAGSGQTIIFALPETKLPMCIYWGGALPESEDLEHFLDLQQRDVTGGMLDQLPDITVCPIAYDSYHGHPGLISRNQENQLIKPDFKFQEVIKESDSKAVIKYADIEMSLIYKMVVSTDSNSGLISLSAALESSEDIFVDWFAAPVLPVAQNGEKMLGFTGRWLGEFQTQNITWQNGAHICDNQTGRSGHEYFPSLFFPDDNISNSNGQVYGVHYGWSGGHKHVAEQFPDGRRLVQFGHASYSEVSAGTCFETAPLYLAYSDQGLNGVGQQFQNHIRQLQTQQEKLTKFRPVHYNCWESIYFDHNLDQLIDIAKQAADLGAERFVLDDGWFKGRNDDTSSLGDWIVDRHKYPDGLGPLIDAIHQQGMSFGIWFEPEMVNQDSDLYRAHPEWILGAMDQIEGRQQRVLDLSHSQVTEYLFNKIADILNEYDIEYVKWDHNRVLPHSDARQTRAVYELFGRLRDAFPHVEFESCASGGGRIDLGILEYCQRVWLSDSNDALERVRIQHNAALFLPSTVTGSHVGPRICHTSGRQHSIAFRAWVAAQRHMGFEMDPRELTAEEKETLRYIVTWWKQNRDWMMNADIFRLDSADPSVIAELQLAGTKENFVAFINKIDTSSQVLPRAIQLAGLEAKSFYKIKLVNKSERIDLSRGENLLMEQDHIRLSGRYLMSHGLNLPWQFPNSCWVIEGKKEI